MASLEELEIHEIAEVESCVLGELMIKDSIGVVGTATPRPSLRLKVDVTPSGPRPRPRSSYEVETCCTRRRFSLQNIGCTVKRLRWLRHAHQCGATPPRSASRPQHAPVSAVANVGRLPRIHDAPGLTATPPTLVTHPCTILDLSNSV